MACQLFYKGEKLIPRQTHYTFAQGLELEVNDILVHGNNVYLVNTAHTTLSKIDLTKLTLLISNMSSMYPVGSIYSNIDSTFDPNTYFTGTTWEKLTTQPSTEYTTWKRTI